MIINIIIIAFDTVIHVSTNETLKAMQGEVVGLEKRAFFNNQGVYALASNVNGFALLIPEKVAFGIENGVIAFAAGIGVRPIPASQDVVTISAIERVVTIFAKQDIVASSTKQSITASAAK